MFCFCKFSVIRTYTNSVMSSFYCKTLMEKYVVVQKILIFLGMQKEMINMDPPQA